MRLVRFSREAPMTRRFIGSSIATAAALAALLIARPALAGPPLLCHPFDIGTARSLPWNGTTSWFHGDAGYDLARLTDDVEALLTPSTPIIVRMETLRRAAIYASRDGQVASRLLGALNARARPAEKSGKADALALLDVAYVTEAFRQMTRLEGEFRGRAPMLRALVGTSDGYVLVKKALEVRPDDPALEFAAALIAADKDRTAYQDHARKARAGANRDGLLARNIGHVS
jgi:hypothetical protein